MPANETGKTETLAIAVSLAFDYWSPDMSKLIQSTQARDGFLRDLLSVIRNVRAGLGLEGILDIFSSVKLDEVPSFIESIRTFATFARAVDADEPQTLEAVIDAGLDVAREFSEVTEFPDDDEWAKMLETIAGPSTVRTTLVGWLAMLVGKYLEAKESGEAFAAAAFDPLAVIEAERAGKAAAAMDITTLVDLAICIFKLWQSLRNVDTAKLAVFEDGQKVGGDGEIANPTP